MTVINNSLKPAILGAGIKTLQYDNTTLSDHLDEILSYTNVSNGGTLLFIGFKLAEQFNGNRIKISTSGTSVTNSPATLELNTPLISNETFLTLRPVAVDPDNGTVKSVKFISADPANNGILTLLLDKSGNEYKAIISGYSTIMDGSTLNQYAFGDNGSDFNMINKTISHLVIEYQTSN